MTHEDTIAETVKRHSHKYREGIVYYYDEAIRDTSPVFYEDCTDDWCILKDDQAWHYRQRIDVEKWEFVVRESVAPEVLGSDPEHGNYALFMISEEIFSKIKAELQKKAATATSYQHIEIRHDGRPWLIGTQTKVIEVALDRLANHWDADEIHRQHPHLTLGQIYSCLAFYCDHQEEMDKIIEGQLQTIKRLRAQQGESNLEAKLKAKGIAS